MGAACFAMGSGFREGCGGCGGGGGDYFVRNTGGRHGAGARPGGGARPHPRGGARGQEAATSCTTCFRSAADPRCRRRRPEPRRRPLGPRRRHWAAPRPRLPMDMRPDLDPERHHPHRLPADFQRRVHLVLARQHVGFLGLGRQQLHQRVRAFFVQLCFLVQVSTPQCHAPRASQSP